MARLKVCADSTIDGCVLIKLINESLDQFRDCKGLIIERYGNNLLNGRAVASYEDAFGFYYQEKQLLSLVDSYRSQIL